MKDLGFGLEKSIFERLFWLQMRKAEQIEKELRDLFKEEDGFIFRNLLHIVFPRRIVSTKMIEEWMLADCSKDFVGI
eukprot:CAMPEP_0202963298 /NCGR_PEP_ID=MMETSP1396-20130829/7282_1 /ASSEMBLY_ACC=CAM_ASM_000872 /TAXON_ID= /ORGANISM="Pseudokeronopsis sp., Strain Brazil" /LENGTH=76 /DNA_ID=CAMNT_0049684383 /DNA_START=1120 /DNA_END=1350 /DNA_ORIENTATION=+